MNFDQLQKEWSEKFRGKIMEFVGEASMCWDSTGSAIFDSEAAIKVGDKIFELMSEMATAFYEAGKEEKIKMAIPAEFVQKAHDFAYKEGFEAGQKQTEKEFSTISGGYQKGFEAGKREGYQEEAIRCHEHCMEARREGFDAGKEENYVPAATVNLTKYKSAERLGFLTALKKVRGAMPKDKDITLNEVGTVGDYHTHGFNECWDAVRAAITKLEEE